MTASTVFHLTDPNQGGHMPPKFESDQALTDLHDAKSQIERVITFDRWLQAHGFAKATSLDTQLGKHVACNDASFYFRWHGEDLLVASIRKGEILLWIHRPHQAPLNLDQDEPHKHDFYATAYIMDLG